VKSISEFKFGDNIAEFSVKWVKNNKCNIYHASYEVSINFGKNELLANNYTKITFNVDPHEMLGFQNVIKSVISARYE